MSTVPKVTEAHRAARRAEIVAAALRCFARAGFQHTSMADIIAESQLSAGAIYGYFDSKKELLAAVADTVLTERQAQIAAATADHPLSPADLIENMLRELGDREFFRVLVQIWAEAAADPDLRSLLQGVVGTLQDSVMPSLIAWAESHPEQTGPNPADWAADAFPVLLSISEGYVLQNAVLDSFDPAAYFAAVRRLL